MQSHMGEEVLPLSPRSLFLGIWTFFSQNFNAVVSSFKKFRWAWPWYRGGRTLHGNDVWWSIFGNLSWFCMCLALLNFMVDPSRSMTLAALHVIFSTGALITHFTLMHSIVYWYGDMPFKLMGAKAKFMIEVIPMIIAAALHHLLEFNYGYLLLLLVFTIYFYTFAHFMHVAYDIGGKDVLLGLLMPVLGYMLNVELLLRALALSFCLGFSFYRYVTYCAPEVPAHSKKELERLPC
ncbi:uncharacterized protein LOC132609717 isoform X1 [Lycium barbarum]|uniref:uncharacterized protein LOC132609717 isoform X1 n=2 Tax=Lycium barbarum TaxID=112863 RepID=UPI00293EEEA1|nr:uncharacterized protein LOC132609717 isoform X1 [Lycium barbarum]